MSNTTLCRTWKNAVLNEHGVFLKNTLTSEVKPLREMNAKAQEEIATLKENQRWRKFPDEKPPHDTWCIVYHEGEIDVDHYTDDCNSHDRFVMYGHYVTHWMPLPSAPKEDK